MVGFVVKHMASKDDIADVKSTLADHTKILNDHTRDLAIIKKDLTTNLDKRLQLEVRVSAIEKHLGLNTIDYAIISLSSLKPTRPFLSARVGKGHQVPF